MPNDALDIQRGEQRSLTPMDMIQKAFESAIANGAGLEVVDRILAQQREMIDYQDRERFQSALRRIQDRLKVIPKLGYNPQTRSTYATAESIDHEIDKLLQQEKMTLNFEPEMHPDPSMVTVVGVLSMGAYSKRYPLPMPADGQGAKGGGVMSRTHATGSAITYAKRYLKNMIFNLRFAEKDDDGNMASEGRDTMNENTLLDWISAIQECTEFEALKACFAKAYKSAKELNDGAAQKQITAAYEAMKKKFAEVQR